MAAWNFWSSSADRQDLAGGRWAGHSEAIQTRLGWRAATQMCCSRDEQRSWLEIPHCTAKH